MFGRVISLERRPDRLEKFMVQASHTDIPELVDLGVCKGVDGSKLDMSTAPLTRGARMTLYHQVVDGYRREHADLSYGAVGCYMSHLKSWSDIIASGKEYGVIFEDDVDIDVSNVMALIMSDIENAPLDWDMLVYVPDSMIQEYTPLYGDFEYIQRWFGLHMYVIRTECILRIMPKMLPMDQQIDSELSDMATSGMLKVYRPTSMKTSQDDSTGTDIQVSIE
jgi:hypothetical protein